MSHYKLRPHVFRISVLSLMFCVVTLKAVTTSIPAQSGQDIVCNGPQFTYQHDVRQHGIDINLTISGPAGLGVETGDLYASYYTDTTYLGAAAVFQYSFVAEAGKLLGDVSVASRANIYAGGVVVGEYKIGEGSWVQFLLAMSGETRPIDIFENVHSERFTIRYTVSWTAQWADHAQLFRSSGPTPGQPGDYAFMFTASVISDANCHKANLAGESSFIDLADFAVLAADYGLIQVDLAGDINGNGSCDLEDLQWLARWWLCNCYSVGPS